MGKQLIVLVLFSIATMAAYNSNSAIAAKSVLKKNILHKNEKVTQLQLYVQDILSGPNPTNIVVASANTSFTSPTFFGLVAVLDDPVRTGPTTGSDIVGRAQGLITFSSLEEQSLHMTFDLVFTKGEFNGSTLNLVGHNPYLQAHRELSIVGGSGAFRLARGFVGVRTVSLNSSTGDAFFQYNITALHYNW